MRKILFRGFHKLSESWVEGNLLGRNTIIPKGQIFYVLFNEILPSEKGLTAYWVIPATIGQYTGRNDKNGVKVFEDDIVKCHDTLKDRTFVGVVGYDSCSFMICGGGTTHYRWDDYDVEVIGNIHDNPELLEDA